MNTKMPKKGAKVVVAMSGGVDSSVAAGWLKQQGYEVVGISLQLHDMAEHENNKFGTCCSLSDISDARRVAEILDVPFYVSNMEELFHKAVIDDFVHEYLVGRTPNPCVRCNEKVKFRNLMDWALDLGAEYLATGHYAQIRFNPETKEHELCKGKDPEKDQSYFLFTTRQEDLERSLFPVGNFSKPKVRELAEKLGLAHVAKKPDSQEICFVQSRSYKEFIEQKVAPSMLKPGNIVDMNGKSVGEHSGIYQFTVGQRKGIPVRSLEPLFVVHVDAEKNEVKIGPESALFGKKCKVSHLHWINPPNLDRPRKYSAKIRYRAKESEALVTPLFDNRVEVDFTEPQKSITPGQALVFYDGDRVVGGGWIESV